MTKRVSIDESNQVQPPPLEMKPDMSGLDDLDTGIEIQSEMPTMSQAELELFMNEKVLIQLHRIKDAEPTEFVSPTVNGRPHHLVRGIPLVVARKYVEVLARSHETSYDYGSDAEAAIVSGALPRPHSSPMHPFEVLKDTAKGHAWLADIRRQAI